VTRLIAVLCLAAVAAPGGASAAARPVAIPGFEFEPKAVKVLVGDYVRWTNRVSTPHDVWSSPDGTAFMSGLLTSGQWFDSPPFSEVGDIPYFCHEHAYMTGVVRVGEVWLTGPSAPVLHGTTVTLRGLAPEGTEVHVERLVNGTWTPVATVTSGGNDVFTHSVPAVLARYRAVLPTDHASEEVAVVVKPRVTLAKKRLPRKRTRVTVTAAPNRAGAMAVLQRKKPAGWSAIASKRLGSNSKAAFVVRPPKGTWRVRAIVKASGGYAAGQSGVVAVKR
jgi:plastocyanin